MKTKTKRPPIQENGAIKKGFVALIKPYQVAINRTFGRQAALEVAQSPYLVRPSHLNHFSSHGWENTAIGWEFADLDDIGLFILKIGNFVLKAMILCRDNCHTLRYPQNHNLDSCIHAFSACFTCGDDSNKEYFQMC